jgi:cobalamin-dependent methionine synthase I
MSTKKVSLSLAEGQVDDLDIISQRLSISRSALVSQLLAEALPEMRRVIELIPAAPTPADLVRFRGESTAIVEQRMEKLRQVTTDLFRVE